MAGKIPRSFIDDILAKTNIVDVISPYVKLKKSGSEFQACCPFHTEKTPSFSVSPKKQFYYCFGCHAKGNVISFLMNYKNLNFVESVEELAGILGLTVPYEQNSNFKFNITNSSSYASRTPLYEIMAEIAQYYQRQLPKNSQACEYLEKRGLSPEVIQKFYIGFALNSYDNLEANFRHTPNFQKNFVDLGMLIKSERGHCYDRFRNRIMFPIRDKSGRVVAFGGRVLDNSKPKYLNSPETKIYHKGSELYGLYEATNQGANHSLAKLLIVEGYMDVVALAQFGVDYAVASLGTATTLDQLRLAFRYTDQIICCYDGDRAGREAGWRTLENVLPLLDDQKQIKFIFLPEKDDPDSFIRSHGKEVFEGFIEQSQTLGEFLFNHLKPQVDFSSPEGRAKLFALAKPLIEKVKGEALRQHLLNTLQNLTGIWNEDLLKLKPTLPKPKEQTSTNRKLTPMRLLISLLVQNPEFANLTTANGRKITLPSPIDFNEAGFELFTQIFNYCQTNLGINTGQLLEYFRETPHYEIINTLASWSDLVSEEQQTEVFLQNLNLLYQRFIDQRTKKLIAKERACGLMDIEKQELLMLLNYQSLNNF